jgi:DNA-binding winged helix-turn-helix (wHTH) protein
VRFGDFALDGGTRQLRRGDEERHLGPKAFELLELLLSQRPNVVTRERIRDRLWPGTFVSESTLATVVAELRAALDDDAKEPRFLRTVHRVGYAFCGAVTEEGAVGRARKPARERLYRLVLPDREVALRSGENLVGRVEDGTVWLDSATVSRRHARIVVEGDRVTLEDLGSKNGTFVGERRIESATPLADGDSFRVGRVQMTLRAVRPDEDTRTDLEG